MAMTEYRFFTADLLTGNVVGELELYGVYASKILSGAGQFTGTVRLINDKFRDSLAEQATRPARNAIYIERNGTLIWGGILWSRTYNTSSQAFELSGQTFESYWDHIALDAHFIQQKVNQELIFQALLNQCQGMPSSNIGLTIASLPTTNVPRTVLIPGYEFHFASEALNQIVNVDNGLEYTIDITPSATVDHPNKVIRLGYPELGAANAELVYDYPGNIADYWMPESGANSGAKFAALGFGSGNKIARAVATDADALAAGYPAWWIVNQYSSIADLSLLQDKVSKDAERFKIPFKSPTFELRSDIGIGFNGWNNLGDTFKIHIEDVRYPDGFDITSRMIGWELYPGDSEGPEILKFAIEGADA